ncbi:hypothetical protein [Actinoplanes sp. NPDC051494]|uniref:hypothetical protein n=1 Tax=Actinoplanes sp. NPDC051494 TaxID=3363907 RepID=UPI0037B9B2CF
MVVVRTDSARRRVEHLTRRPWYDFHLDAFTTAERGGTPVLTGAADAVRTMSVIDDIYAAAGLPTRLPMR